MSEQQPQAEYFWRGGKKMSIRRMPNKFTVRVRQGVNPETLSNKYNCRKCQSLDRQNLAEFETDGTRGLDDTLRSLQEDHDVEFASNVYRLDADPHSQLYPTDEITLQFKQEVSDEQIEAIIEDQGLEIVKEVKGLDKCWVVRLAPHLQKDSIVVANELQENEHVEVAEPNIAIGLEKFYVPSDNLYSDQWHLQHNGGPQLSENSHVFAEGAWDITLGERSVVVAIMDDSVDLDHDDLAIEDKIVAPRDFKGSDFEPIPESASDNHGTACAGVAVAEENGQGVVGVAPGCSLMPLRMTGFLDDNSIENQFEWAMDNGASVVSCSWGAAAINFPLSLRQTTVLRRLATEGREGKGIVICFAAGNANRPVNGTVDEKNWPNNALSGPTDWLGGYAANEHVIAVSACTSQNRKSAYSNWGDEISICAPSNNGHPGVGSSITYPRITSSLPGRGIVTTDRVGSAGYSSSDYTFSFGGTSSACPLAAGVAALVLSANPDLTAQEVREILEATADKIVDNREDPQLGNSFGNYDENGHSKWFGYGKVNAEKAVKEAIQRKTSDSKLVYKKSSTPNLAIPYNDTVGIVDTIRFDEAAFISDVKVNVDISHTYIGDLRVSLAAPTGENVVLQNRRGGRVDDIQTTFDISNTTGLSSLLGRTLQGDWKLSVQDFAPLDTGTLNAWEIEFSAREDTAILLESSPGITIPDNDRTGIEDTIKTEAEGTIKEIEVSLDITHTYIGDISVTLFSPEGTEIILHNRVGGPLNNIDRTYSFATTSALKQLAGQVIKGEWVLKLIDNAGADVGKLNRWAIRIIRAETAG